MARSKTVHKPEDEAPEEQSQEHDSSPEHESQDQDDHAMNGKVSQADMVRAAIAAGATTGKPGVEWIKRNYGDHVKIDANSFGAAKAQIVRRGVQKGHSPNTASENHDGRVRSTNRAANAVPSGLADDLENIGELIQSVGGGDKDLALDRIGMIGSLLDKYGTSELTGLVELVNKLRS